MLFSKQETQGAKSQPKPEGNSRFLRFLPWGSFFLSLLGFFLSLSGLYGLFCTLYSVDVKDISSINVFSSYDSIYKERSTVGLGDILHAKDEGKVYRDNSSLYIFGLDRSMSIPNSAPESLLNVYSRAMAFINAELATNYFKKQRPSFQDIATAQASYLLIELYRLQKLRNTKERHFTIWDIGNVGLKIFPEIESKADVSKKNVGEAIKKLFNETPRTKNTDFISLCDRLKRQYPDEFSLYRGLGFYASPPAIITIFSDFIHDAPDRSGRSPDTDDNNKLMSCLGDLCSSNVMFNCVYMGESEPEINNNKIIMMFKDNMQDHYLKGCCINELRWDEFYFSTEHSSKKVEFYYSDSPIIQESYFIIESNESNDIEIDIPPNTIELLAASKVSIYCENLDKANSGKKLISGGFQFRSLVEKGNRIQFSYSGPLPSPLSDAMVRISSKNDKKQFLLPIIFTKRLPYSAVYILRILHSMSFLVVLIMFAIIFYKPWTLLSLIIYNKSRNFNKN
jgi:hypothetical protein